MATYKAATGSLFNDTEAQEIGEYLESYGEFTPSQVVNAARDSNSPIHKYFEWDDLKAAESFRLDQARTLVNHIHIVVQVNHKLIETKAFHNVIVKSATNGDRKYVSFNVAKRTPDIRGQILENYLGQDSPRSRRLRMRSGPTSEP